MATTVSITSYGIQKNTDNTCYVFWSFTKSKNTKEYQVKWEYVVGGKTFIGQEDSTTKTQATYGAPSNAEKVYVSVKPISKTYVKKKKKCTYFTGSWCTKKTIQIDKKTPEKSAAPEVEIDGLSITCSLSTYDTNTKKVRFCIAKNDSTTVITADATVKTNAASFKYGNLATGQRYKVRCRGINASGTLGEWSEYSQNVYTRPSAPAHPSIFIRSRNLVEVIWSKVSNAVNYTVEYTTDESFFDSSSSVQSIESSSNNAIIEGLEYGKAWFFRVRANAKKAEESSEWSEVKMIVLSEEPAPPTTWSNSVTIRNDEDIIFYINHNSTDGSSATACGISMTVNGEPYENGQVEVDGRIYPISEINLTERDEKDKDKTIVAKLVDDPLIREGVTILWKAFTVGICYIQSDWSVERRIDVYSNPTVDLSVSSDPEVIGNEFITSMPIYIKAEYSAGKQKAISYNVKIIAKEAYDIVDETGMNVHVSENDEVYSRYSNYDYQDANEFITTINAGEINLINNVGYSAVMEIVMDSGLVASNSYDFVIAWDDDDSDYNIDAEITVDEDLPYGCYITPSMTDLNDNYLSNYFLSVYRREYDGSLVKIESNIQNDGSMVITDPHPALDYARYRIVATSKTTGRNYSEDLPGEPVGVSSIILQWDDDWHNYTNDEPDSEDENPAITGSIIELKYNIKTSESHSREISYGNYIGRKHPVSYYGTQLGETASWSSDIPKDDTETILKLRRLAVYQGNVYVRSPNGVGFWATVDVSFPLDYDSLSSTVSLNITRVEGGI